MKNQEENMTNHQEMIQTRFNSTTLGSYKTKLRGNWDRLVSLIDSEQFQIPYFGKRIGNLTFKKPSYVRGGDCDVLALAVMRLLIQCAYNTRYLSGKFTIGYVMEVKGAGIVNCTIGTAIPLESSSGNAVCLVSYIR